MSDHPANVQVAAAWDLIARHHCRPEDMAPSSSSTEAATATAAALAAYERGHASLAATEQAAEQQHLWQMHVAYLQQRLEGWLTLAQDDGGSLGKAAAITEAAAAAKQLLKLLQRAAAAGAADEQLYMNWAQAATRLGQPSMALKALRAGCSAQPLSWRLWQVMLRACVS
jgi:hypothetical protein